MAGDLSLDQAGANDDGAIADAIRGVRTADGDAAGFTDDYTAERAGAWRSDLEARNGGVIIARIDDNVAGFGSLEPVDEQVASLGVWVVPWFRRQGIGTALARAVLDLARERGFRRIRGRMLESEGALSFLGSVGALVPIANPQMEFELPL